jgi:hypothetical protein
MRTLRLWVVTFYSAMRAPASARWNEFEKIKKNQGLPGHYISEASEVRLTFLALRDILMPLSTLPSHCDHTY